MVNAVTEFVYRGIASLDPHKCHHSVVHVERLQSLGMGVVAGKIRLDTADDSQ